MKNVKTGCWGQTSCYNLLGINFNQLSYLGEEGTGPGHEISFGQCTPGFCHPPPSASSFTVLWGWGRYGVNKSSSCQVCECYQLTMGSPVYSLGRESLQELGSCKNLIAVSSDRNYWNLKGYIIHSIINIFDKQNKVAMSKCGTHPNSKMQRTLLQDITS